MPRKYFIVILALLMVSAILLMATPGERLEVTPAKDMQTVQSPAVRGPCSLAYTNGSFISYFSGFAAGMQNVTYFNPETCPALPAYPFEITDFSFTLYGFAGAVWPVDVDVIIYDMAVTGDSCSGPGAELCRVSVTCDQAVFELPNVGMVTFPTPCCVNGPFYAGIEYTDQGAGSFPSVAYDDQAPANNCFNWFYYDGVWYEWETIWTPPAPGFPMFWVNGETESPNCISGCSWQPGDDHKMHFPQLPNEAGWDVNATEPVVLADDFMCMKTGPITDVHWWGGWKNDIEGEITSFILSIHSDIPADQNPDGYSKPGMTLWELEVFDFNATMIDPPSMEGWYDPATGETIWEAQAHYWQYDVCIDPVMAYYQDSGTVYWLNISARVADPQGTTWGWKSTEDHWNDDAVWAYWGELNWIDIWEPAAPLTNAWGIAIDPMGTFLGGFGENSYGDGWYFYPEEDWWNIWFYDHPFDSTRKKFGMIEFDAFPMNQGMPMWLEVAVNWSTDIWSIEHPEEGPPLPGVPESIYIGRQILFGSDYFEGHYGPFLYEIPDYNPEWVSVDVRGWNFDIPAGIIEHTCEGSLDLAFVITGEPLVVDSGACCFDPTGGGIDASCIYTTLTYCEQILGGVFEGVGVPCQGMEACCLPDGNCTMADALCCVNELGGTPQGAGSSCTATEACCFPDGTCRDLDPLCCVDLGGTPQGIGSSCSPAEACCMSDGSCRMLTPECCNDLGGTPQGIGTTCAATIACCMPDGTCQTLSRVCCDDIGGTPSPIGAPMCLGDMNGDGTDDACLVREDLKWRQAPDLDPTGMDVAATCPSLSHECIVLADDFLCTESGPITEIHIYGSWFGDGYPIGDPGNVVFTLSFHTDVPAGIDQPWSHPREMIWMNTFGPGQFDYRPFGMDLIEGYYDPIIQFYEPVGDFTCWEYIFYLDEPFIQQGTEIDPVTYWLDVQAYPEGESYFGWKSSVDHWNDDGVWAIGMEPIDPLIWVELRYPFGHPYETMSIDLAFELYGEPEICDCIPGDANNDGAVNVGDAVYLIAYVFKGGPAPVPYPICSGDANCDCMVNVGDAVYVISYVFKGGPAPCDCPTWLSICGPPLRK